MPELDLEPTLLGLRDLTAWLATELDQESRAPFRHRLGEIELAVHEVMTNAVVHAAPGFVRVSSTVEGGDLIFTVKDDGKPFDQSAYSAPDPDLPQVHGYGLMIVEQLAKSCAYTRCGSENVWTISFTSIGT